MATTNDTPVRIVTIAPLELREALRLEAAKRGLEMSEVAVEILTEGLAESLAEVRRRRQSGRKPTKE